MLNFFVCLQFKKPNPKKQKVFYIKTLQLKNKNNKSFTAKWKKKTSEKILLKSFKKLSKVFK